MVNRGHTDGEKANEEQKKIIKSFFWSQFLLLLCFWLKNSPNMTNNDDNKKNWRKRIILPSCRCFISVKGVKKLCEVKWSQDYNADCIKDSKLSSSVLQLHLSLQLKDDLSTPWQSKTKITHSNFGTIVFNANKPPPATKCINKKSLKQPCGMNNMACNWCAIFGLSSGLHYKAR